MYRAALAASPSFIFVHKKLSYFHVSSTVATRIVFLFAISLYILLFRLDLKYCRHIRNGLTNTNSWRNVTIMWNLPDIDISSWGKFYKKIQESKVKLRLKNIKPRYLDQCSVIVFPSVFIFYNTLYWTFRCIWIYIF